MFQLEFENSIKSDHELRQEKDKVTLEALKAGSASEADLEQATKATAQDFEDSSLEELSKFKFSSRLDSECVAFFVPIKCQVYLIKNKF